MRLGHFDNSIKVEDQRGGGSQFGGSGGQYPLRPSCYRVDRHTRVRNQSDPDTGRSAHGVAAQVAGNRERGHLRRIGQFGCLREQNGGLRVVLVKRGLHMTDYRLAFTLLLCAAAPAAMAQTVVAPQNVTAVDVVTAPLSELNLKKNEIPPVLLAARERPYDLTGLRACRAIQSEVGQLNAALGDDIDITTEKTRDEKRGNAVGSVAKSVISSFIPFGGVIREVSGAAASERQWQVALYAGASRRAFLKGYRQARGCPYPARAASARDVAAVSQMRAGVQNVDSAPPAKPVRHKRKKHVRR